MRILITRPFEKAITLASHLQDLGHIPLIDSLLQIVPVKPPLFSLSDFGAIITTSQHAILRLAALGSRRDMPLWCVGSESAKIAKKLRFNNIFEGGGSASALISALASSTASSGLPYLHLSGRKIRVDVAKILTKQGIVAQRVIVYKTREADCFSGQTVRAFKKNELDAVLLYSPRTAWLFQKLCRQAELEALCSRITAVCLSETVGQQILELPWKNICISRKPTTDDLLMALIMAN